MMLIEDDSDDYELVSEIHVCDYHKRHPHDKSWPGCTCNGSHGLRKKRAQSEADDD